MTAQAKPWPADFMVRIREQFPGAAELFIAALEQNARISVRLNPAKFTAKPHGEQVPWCNEAYFLPERPTFALDPLWHVGTYYVQEASSMFLEQAFRQVKVEGPKMVLDLCAAPGGKSTHLNSLLGKNDLLVSNEVIRARVQVLIENLSKWGYPNAVITNADPKQFGELEGLFDVLVIDAPCSGEGLFRRNPEAANEWNTENARLCAVRQRRILADSWPCLKSGGYLIYSTCTFNPAENEDNLQWLRQQCGFESIRLPLQSEWQVDELETEGIYGYRFLPHKVQGEGFFISILKKTEATVPIRFPKKFATRLQNPPKSTTHWVINPANKLFFQHQDQLKFIPANWENEILMLFEKLNVVKAGVHFATLKKNDLLPEHELAMSTELVADSFDRVELSHEDALRFLGRDNFQLPHAGSNWELACFGGLPLGFLKNLGNRFNNYYPKEWRLRMNERQAVPLWHKEQ
ncbi:MAG: methyltransferase RsmF C-terminal domain-like protein [Mangrovibacterium sp.]